MRAEVMTLGTPNPRQREFLACEKKYVAFGGARGGGKSWAVRCKAKLLALRYAGIRILLVRRSLAELEAKETELAAQIRKMWRNIGRGNGSSGSATEAYCSSATAGATAIWTGTRARSTTSSFWTRPRS